MNRLNKILLCSLIMFVNGVCFAAAPIVLKIINNTGVDVNADVIEADHIAEKDVVTIQSHTIYGGRTDEFYMNRTDAPVHLSIQFHAAQGEGKMAGYFVGRWEYVESTPRYPIETAIPDQSNYTVDSCHNYSSEVPYTISCLGTDSFPNPSATVTIDNVAPK